MSLHSLSLRNIDPVPPCDSNSFKWVFYFDEMAFCETRLWGAQKVWGVFFAKDESGATSALRMTRL